MNLSESIGTYLSMSEAKIPVGIIHDLSNEVQRQLSKCTLEELLNEYNKLSTQNLWSETLVNLFTNELLARVDTATFQISIAWDTISDWISDPMVVSQVGFEENNYPLPRGSMVVSVDGDSFVESPIRLFLRKDIGVEVSVGDTLGIESIFNWNDPIERYMVDTPDIGTGKVYVKSVCIKYTGFRTLDTAIQGLKEKSIPIVPIYI